MYGLTYFTLRITIISMSNSGLDGLMVTEVHAHHQLGALVIGTGLKSYWGETSSTVLVVYLTMSNLCLLGIE